MITEIIDHIFTVDHQVAEGKNAIILSQRGAWAVDAGTHPAEGQAMADFIRQRGFAPNRLLLTHGHGDHVLGSAAFRGADVFAHTLTPVEIRRLLPLLAQRANTTVAELASQIAWPTITFSDELRIDLGDKHLRLFPTPGHSQDGISIYVEEHKLLIAGDSVVTGIVPAIGDGDSRVLEATLHKLADLEIDILVPGHGAVVYGQEAVKAWLTWIPRYLSSVRNALQAALQTGSPHNQVVTQIAYDDLIGDRLPKEKHKMEKRHQDTVRKILSEITSTDN